MGIKGSLRGPTAAQFATFQQQSVSRIERAALVATDRAQRLAVSRIRGTMAGASLGRLGNAIGGTSDLQQDGRVHRRGTGFSASGVIYIRGRNERTVGAIISYTEGSTINPTKGPWLWIASLDLQRKVAGNFRLTPARYRSSGLEQKIGPLISIPGRNAGERLLVVRDVTVRMAGKANPRRLPKNGRARAGRQQVEQFVAFVGIRRTSRQARVDPRAIIAGVQREMPDLWSQAMGSRNR
jgi:hypothetical protein